jgi:demethylmacrocin O-methyltransferase
MRSQSEPKCQENCTLQSESSLKEWLRRNLPAPVFKRLKSISMWVVGWWYRNNLTELALLYRTDKWGMHWYTPHYDRYFREIKSRPLNILEIGVGGYDSADQGGGSLRMWKAYFRSSRIVGIDIYDKRHFSEHRIDIRQCDQTDEEALTRLSGEYGGFDIIIDDGSHLNQHVIQTFEILFPLLRSGGIYVAEDLQTAYWPTFGGGINHPKSSMTYFKKLADGLNYMEFPIADYRPSFFDENIVEISFLHNLAFIRKGRNDEKSNCPGEIQAEIGNLMSRVND